ncbi:MAG: hypothetical protein AB1609_20495, partial [Bacillota bacterium]
VASVGRSAGRALQAAGDLEARVESALAEVGQLEQGLASHLADEAARSRDEAERRAATPRLSVGGGTAALLAGDRTVYGYLFDMALALERRPLRGGVRWGVRATAEGEGNIRGGAGVQLGGVRMLGANLSFGGEVVASAGSSAGTGSREFVSLAWQPYPSLSLELGAGWHSGAVPDPDWLLEDAGDAGYAWGSLSWSPRPDLPGVRGAVGRVWAAGAGWEPATAWLVASVIPLAGEAGGASLKLEFWGVAGRPPRGLLAWEVPVDL